MIGKLADNHPHEYPIAYYWYTKHNGHTIEYIIDHDLTFFEWCVRTFQDITPSQAEYYKKKTGLEVPKECIQYATPYHHEPGDPEGMYPDLCTTRDLEAMIFKWREGSQLDLFEALEKIYYTP